jgi:predicted metal-dependent hydrolase
MTLKDFNQKHKHLVVEGFDGLEFKNKQVAEFLDTLFESIVLVYPNFKVSQIKVKWGSCRFYSNLPMQLNFEIENHINEML